MTTPIVKPPVSAVHSQGSRALAIALAVAAIMLNAMFVLFFVLWSAADEWAVDRSEARGGFDPSQLLPHGGLMWVAAHLVFAALIGCDVLCALMLVRARKRA